MRMICRVLFPVLCACLVATATASAGGRDDDEAFGRRANTEQGPIAGLVVPGFPVVAWLGVPFARPPVGDLRWKAPVDPPHHSARLETTRFGKPCFQGSPDSSEDCLTLNIWRPNTGEKNLPVFVFVHGGSNIGGSGQDSWYTVAQHYNVVVVAINYRLGPMGWFLHPALQTGDPAGDSGNFGILDQIKALEWVHRNAHHFGGDAWNVTLAGQSAGSQDVSYLLHSPLAKKYFQKAVIESNFPGIRPVAAALKSSKQVLYNLLVADGTAADTVSAKAYVDTRMSNADIRRYFYSKSAADISNAYSNGWLGGINWGDFYRSDISFGEDYNAPPLIQAPENRPEFVYAIGDGYVLPKGIPFADFSTGHVFPKPLIVGTTRNENNAWNAYWPFNYQQGKSLDTLVAEAVNGTNANYGYLQHLYDLFGNHDPATFKKNYWATTRLIDELDTYLAVTLPARNLARNPDATGKPVYVYRFDWSSDPAKDYKFPNQDAWKFYAGAIHSTELDFFYQKFFGLSGSDSVDGYPYTRGNLRGRQALSLDVKSYLYEFFHNRDGRIGRTAKQPVDWLPWTRDAERYMVFDADHAVADVHMSSSDIPRTPQELYEVHAALPNAAARDFVEYYVLWSWHYNWYPNAAKGHFDTSPGPNALFDPARP